MGVRNSYTHVHCIGLYVCVCVCVCYLRSWWFFGFLALPTISPYKSCIEVMFSVHFTHPRTLYRFVRACMCSIWSRFFVILALPTTLLYKSGIEIKVSVHFSRPRTLYRCVRMCVLRTVMFFCILSIANNFALQKLHRSHVFSTFPTLTYIA